MIETEIHILNEIRQIVLNAEFDIKEAGSEYQKQQAKMKAYNEIKDWIIPGK